MNPEVLSGGIERIGKEAVTIWERDGRIIPLADLHQVKSPRWKQLSHDWGVQVNQLPPSSGGVLILKLKNMDHAFPGIWYQGIRLAPPKTAGCRVLKLNPRAS